MITGTAGSSSQGEMASGLDVLGLPGAARPS